MSITKEYEMVPSFGTAYSKAVKSHPTSDLLFTMAGVLFDKLQRIKNPHRRTYLRKTIEKLLQSAASMRKTEKLYLAYFRIMDEA